MVLHNSALNRFRNPVGAVETGGRIRLFLETRDENVLGVKVQFYIENSGWLAKMEPVENGWEYWLSVPDTPCVMWYSFLLSLKQRTLYYGPLGGRTQGEGKTYSAPCLSYQLTVYDREFSTPQWFQGSTMYQIFPDRFRRGDERNTVLGNEYHQKMGRKTYLHENFDEPPLYKPLPGDQEYSPCDFYGGDFAGIKQSLDELKALGVGTLYLNPVVEASSNHRYDTADYRKTDPFLGTNEDFMRLCEAASEKGIRVMMDGVYSHTGSDSLYFNKNGNYPAPGAYQRKGSPYDEWYVFDSSRNGYRCWWNFPTLPEVDKESDSWQKFMFSGPDSVFDFWAGLGVSGIRLDVADELPDDVIEKMRRAWKKDHADRVLLGEVWEDATTKISYGSRRRFAWGRELDSVMNYPFRTECVSFLLGQCSAYALANFLTAQSLNYPKPMYHSLMNLLSSHDVPRIRTVLASGQTGEGMSRDQQAAFSISDEQDKKGGILQRLAAALQFVLPGVPCIYYGDEYGMLGWKDPFNRGPFQKRDESIFEFYRRLAVLRQEEEALRRGSATFAAFSNDVLAVLRFCGDGKDAFSLPAKDDFLLTVLNRGAESELMIDLSLFKEGMTDLEEASFTDRTYRSAKNMASGEEIPIKDGALTLKIPAQRGLFLKLY